MNFSEDNSPQPPIEIDYTKLSSEALKGVIEDFILRSGTDYGSVEASSEAKFQQVLGQIKANLVKVIYDPNTESVTLMNKQDFNKSLQNL